MNNMNIGGQFNQAPVPKNPYEGRNRKVDKATVVEKIKNGDRFLNHELTMLSHVISELSKEEISALIPLGASIVISEQIGAIAENHPDISQSELALAMLERRNIYSLLENIMNFKNLSVTVAKKLIEDGKADTLLLVIDRNPDVFPGLTEEGFNYLVEKVDLEKIAAKENIEKQESLHD